MYRNEKKGILGNDGRIPFVKQKYNIYIQTLERSVEQWSKTSIPNDVMCNNEKQKWKSLRNEGEGRPRVAANSPYNVDRQVYDAEDPIASYGHDL